MAFKVVSVERKNLMIKAYLSGKTQKESAGLVGYTSGTCFNELKRRGITRRTNSQIRRKHFVDETFFKKINTEQKAYWLGFIAGDGNVDCHKKRGSKLSIKLSIKDANHLEKFLHDIKSEYRVIVGKHERSGINGIPFKFARVAICSNKICDSLINLGVTPKKTFTVQPCLDIPQDLQVCYWRGCFDADGSVFKAKSKTCKTGWLWTINFIGNDYMVRGFKDFVSLNTGITRNIYSNHRSKYIVYYGKKALPVVRLLYNNSNIFLDRKKKLADEFTKDLEVS